MSVLMENRDKQLLFRLLQIAAVAVFIGRAWQFLAFGAPYRVLFWDERWMRWLIEGVFNTAWRDYVTSESTDIFINRLINTTGIFYLICAFVAVFIRRLPKIFSNVLWMGGIGLIFLAFLYFKDRFFQIGQLLEYSLQFGSPFFLYFLFRQQTVSKRFLFLLKIAIAFTFISHGLYAIGYYPRPGSFVEMVLNILPIPEDQTSIFLWTVGLLDFIFAALLFFRPPISIYALSYLTFWGLMTTFARLWSYIQIDFLQETLWRWLPEFLMRIPHFLIPFALLMFYWERRKER